MILMKVLTKIEIATVLATLEVSFFLFADLSLQPLEDGPHLKMDNQLPHLIKFGIIWSTELVLISHCFASCSEMSVYRKTQICY